MNKHIGSDFEDFLKEEGRFEDATAVALKRNLALQLQERMNALKVSKSELARRMRTSRTEVHRLLNPKSRALTIATLCNAATALSVQVTFKLTTIRIPKDTQRAG